MSRTSDVIWIFILLLLFLLSSATALANLVAPDPTCTPVPGTPPGPVPAPESPVSPSGRSLGPALSQGDLATSSSSPWSGGR